jgi:hypothetical protein
VNDFVQADRRLEGVLAGVFASVPLRFHRFSLAILAHTESSVELRFRVHLFKAVIAAARSLFDTNQNSRAAAGIIFASTQDGFGNCIAPCISYYSPWVQMQVGVNRTVAPY